MQIIFDSTSAISTAKGQSTKSRSAKIQSVAYKAVLIVVLLASSIAVFLFGANYYALFPTEPHICRQH
jgi:hypothetical protein